MTTPELPFTHENPWLNEVGKHLRLSWLFASNDENKLTEEQYAELLAHMKKYNQELRMTLVRLASDPNATLKESE